MYYGLDALAHGATAALVGLLPALVLFWRLTRGLGGARALRPFVVACAAFGIAVGGAGLWAVMFERTNFADDAIGGAMIAGALAGLVAFLILLMFPRSR